MKERNKRCRRLANPSPLLTVAAWRAAGSGPAPRPTRRTSPPASPRTGAAPGPPAGARAHTALVAMETTCTGHQHYFFFLPFFNLFFFFFFTSVLKNKNMKQLVQRIIKAFPKAISGFKETPSQIKLLVFLEQVKRTRSAVNVLRLNVP